MDVEAEKQSQWECQVPGEKYAFYDNLKSFIARESCAPNKSPPPRSNTPGESVDNYLFSLIKARHVKTVFFKEFLYFTNKHSKERGKNEEAKGRHKKSTDCNITYNGRKIASTCRSLSRRTG